MTEAERYLEQKLRRKSAVAGAEVAAAASPGAGGSQTPPQVVTYACGAAPLAYAGDAAPGNPSVPRVKPGWFTGRGRLNRMSYFLRLLTIMPAYVIGRGFEVSGKSELTVLAFVLILGAGLVQLFQGVKRLHDFDQSGWWLVIPVGCGLVTGLATGFDRSVVVALAWISLAVNVIAGLWIQFAPGTDGTNRFGERPV